MNEEKLIDGLIARKNHLADGHYSAPGQFVSTMTTRQLRETLLQTDGWVLACGYSWHIRHEPLGAGVIRVWLEKRP